MVVKDVIESASLDGKAAVSEPAAPAPPGHAVRSAHSALPDAPARLAVSGVPAELLGEERLRELSQLPLFRDMTPDELAPLAVACTAVRFRAGETIVQQGEPGDSVFIILDGRVEVLARVERNGAVTESVVSWLVAGDALGELSLLDGQPRSATCVAMMPTTCLCLDRDSFLGAAQRHWSLTHALLAVVADRLRQADRRLAEHATDPLTGVNNRRALHDLYEREASRVQRAARKSQQHHARAHSQAPGATGATASAASAGALDPLGLLFVDIDHFKKINDTYGHQTGDDVLCAVAKTLIAAGRATDFVARYGGDEFIVLLPDAGQAGVDVVASRVRQALAAPLPGSVPFTVSIGSALVDPQHPQTLEELMATADEAMYAEKERAHARDA